MCSGSKVVSGGQRRFRYAPTPSRRLHLGNALAAMIGWSEAANAGGTFVLRIEDIDRSRCRPELEALCLLDLSWLGIQWHEGPDVGGPHGPYRQSERLDRYDDILRNLRAQGRTYVCTCSRAQVRAAQSAPHHLGSRSEVPYPGTCRGADKALDPQRGGYRFDVLALGDDAIIGWTDRWIGPRSEDVRQTCGDFLLGRPGHPSYQLAVVADDLAMGITDVVRGRDLAGSTARQLLLRAALSSTPAWRCAHHALLVDEDGRKLSKRDDDLSIAHYREHHTDPGRIRALLGRSIGLFGASIRSATMSDFAAALAATPPTRDACLLDASAFKG